MAELIKYQRLNPPERTLLSPDLSNPSPRARQGLIAILEGANDPSFLKVMDEAISLLRYAWGTSNSDTYLIPGSEETALEAAFFNFLEPGDRVIVAISGYFGERMAKTAERIGAQVVRVESTPGDAVSFDALQQEILKQPTKMLSVLHGDGSTGVQQPLGQLSPLAREHDCLLMVDARWTLGALDINVDELGIDVCVAGSQKGISAYPGLGLITSNQRAAEVYNRRRTTVPSWSLDISHLRNFKTDERPIQTVPAPIVYALTEMLQLSYEQKMEYRVQRHINRRDALVLGLETLGLQIYANKDARLPTVTAVKVPDGIDQDRVRDKLRTPYRIDIGGGLGGLSGKLWRVGVMSHSAQPTYLLSFITLLETILAEEGYVVPNPGQAGRSLLSHLDP